MAILQRLTAETYLLHDPPPHAAAPLAKFSWLSMTPHAAPPPRAAWTTSSISPPPSRAPLAGA